MSWLARIVNVFRRKRLDAAIDEELQFHIDMKAADLESAGLTKTEARREAARLLGNRAALRDRTREADVAVGIETGLQDIRYALRVLRRAPLFTAAACLTVALGVGANAAMFAVLYGVLIRPLPYPESDRLFLLFQGNTRTSARTRVAPLDYVDMQQRSRMFSMAAVAGTGFTLTGDRDPELVIGQLVTADFFDILRARPALGRTFTRAEYESDNPDVIVLSHGLWQRRLGGDPQALGRAIIVNGRRFTVVGVMPRGFSFQGPRYQLWVPFPLRAPNQYNLPINRDSRFVQVLARLAPGVAAGAAADDLAAIAATLARDDPDRHATTKFIMSSLMDEMVGDLKPALTLLFVAVTLLLLMACGNVTSLLLARFTVRGPELQVRAALGASRARIIRQFVTETVVLYAAGTITGVLLAHWLLNLVRTLGAGAVPRLDDVGLAVPVLAFTAATSFGAAILFGLAPAWQATRVAFANTMRSRTATAGRPHQRFRSAIVVAQVAAALCLLTGAGLVTRSLLNLQAVDKGFDPSGRLTFGVVMPAARFPTPASMLALYRRLLDGLGSDQALGDVGVTTHLPLSGQDLENGFTVDGYVAPSPELQPIAALRGISPGYLAALAIPVRAGRAFSAVDDEHAAPVAVVNETFVRRYLGPADPIGRRLSVGGPNGPWRTVVGVVGDVRHRGLAQEPRPEVLLPYVQLDPGFLTAWARGLSVVVRPPAEPPVAATLIRERMQQLDPNTPVITLRPMDALVSDAVAQPRFRTFLLGSFAVVALALAAVGIFGVLSYVVSERTREIGIRMALGAHPAIVFRDVLATGVRLVATGTVLGLMAGVLLTGWISGLLFGVSPADPLMIGAAAFALAVVALFAAFLPAWRATRVDPVVALRT